MFSHIITQGFVYQLGVVASLFLCWLFLSFLHLNFRASSIGRYKHNLSSGDRPWALVTGSSDGLGLAVAHELASHGFNIILHGRNGSKLQVQSERLRSLYPTAQTKILVLDSEKHPISWAEFDTRLNTLLTPLNLTVLVNNVGGVGSAVPDWKLFLSRSHDELDKILNINASFMMHITRTILPLLKRSQPALILNIGSAGSTLPLPYSVAYSSGKAFMTMFSRALSSELKLDATNKGIEVMALDPGPTVTPGSGRTERDLSFDTLSPEVVAKAIVSKVGCGYEQVCPNLVHQIQLAILGKWFPSSLQGWIVRRICSKEHSEVSKRIQRGAWKAD